MGTIEVRGIVKDYPGHRALHGIHLEVQRGEIVGLLGPNGAGKTTLLRILSGALGPSAGRATIEGFDVVTESLEVRRRVGYLPENAPLDTEMTPRQILAFMAGVRRGVGEAEVERAVERCGLDDVLDRPIEHLSKGYRQRVGLAQAILHWPPILLLDEPTTGLDPTQIAEIRALIREIGRDRTVVLSSHILGEVEATCDRVVIIDRGRIRADGTAAELAARVAGVRRLAVEIGGADDGDAAAALGALPGVVRVDAGRDGRLALEAEGDVRAAVFAAVVERGWTLLELRTEVQSLESVYLSLVRDGGDDGGDEDGDGGGDGDGDGGGDRGEGG